MSCSLHDVTEFLKRGIPTVFLCTEPFLRATRAHAAMQGWPEYEPIVIPQLNTLGPQAVEELAKSIAGAIGAAFLK